MTTTPSSRHPNLSQQDVVPIDFAFPQITATASMVIFKAPPGRAYKIDRAYIVDPLTGLAASGVNYVAITVVNSNTSGNSLTWSTQTGHEGSLAAGAQQPMTLSGAAADLVVPAGATLTLTFTVTGAPTLPAGMIRIEGRLL